MMSEAKEFRWYMRITFALFTVAVVGGMVLIGWAAVKMLLKP